MRNIALLTLAAVVVVVALLFVPGAPSEPAAAPAPGGPVALTGAVVPPSAPTVPAAEGPSAEGPDGAAGGAPIPDQPSPDVPVEAGIPVVPPDPLREDCTPVGTRLEAIKTGFSHTVVEAAEKAMKPEQIIARCHQFDKMTDAELLAAIKTDFNLAP